MAGVVGPATPQRPLPGAFMATPAAAQGSTIFAANAATLRQNLQPPPPEATGAANSDKEVSPMEKARKSINDALEKDRKFPELESYISQGISGEYELPQNPAWLPFQKLKMHDLPPRLLEQANRSGMGMQMGVFPPLAHAWVALDNSLYLWDYSLPNPEIIGFEEGTQPITAVKLVKPKPGIFIADIQHMVVVCTTNDMLLLGVAAQSTSTGAQTIALYNTRMSIPIKGLGVSYIEASKKTGRIFFTGSLTDDIFEFQYQQDEGWFRGKCSRICHTKTTMNLVAENISAVGTYFGPQAARKALSQLVIDDSRNLMYSLSTASEVKIWLIKDRLEASLMRPMATLIQSTGHYTNRTDLLTGKDVKLVSLSAIPATQASRIGLVATTNTGCRLFISTTRGYGYSVDAQNPPASMQVLHVRFPPKDPRAPRTPGQFSQANPTTYNQSGIQVDNTSTYLTPTTISYRFSPGYWMAFQPSPDDPNNKDRVFCTATDMARFANASDSGPMAAKFSEFGQWIDLPAEMQQVMAMTEGFGATSVPEGFGNEMAVQFDTVSSEFAIVTTTGIQTIRRRRLVDTFAAIMKYGSTDEEGVEGDIKRFVRIYGRAETSATALAVACGHGLDVSENRVANVTDPEILDKARKAFIEHGGRPEYSANSDVGNSDPERNVRASPRHEGMAQYISRLVRSIWGATIIKDNVKPGIGIKSEPTVGLEKLRSIQRNLTSLREFLDRNRSFIEGLAGPQALARVNTRQEQLASIGEHKAMYSLQQLINSISEGISFVLVLFDERIEEILALLSEDSRTRVKQLTYEGLFTSDSGRDLAKELVKAIVNRNIANGSNVESVAEALRRRCGSFCSADDVVIFKAQEQVKRASENGSQTEQGRMLLNESERLFRKVAESLTFETLKLTVESYIAMAFYAGAIQLCLTVALEKDKSKRALAWMRDNRPTADTRQAAYEARVHIYELIFKTIVELETSTTNTPEMVDGQYTLAAKRRNEAYQIINTSDDVVFLTCLYDWYIENQDQAMRLLDIDHPFVVEYLKNRAANDQRHADLLWRYFVHHQDYLQGAEVQLTIARAWFQDLRLEQRIEYLSCARTNASTRQTILTDSRQSKQRVLREASDLLEIANIQHELCAKFAEESRLTEDRKRDLMRELEFQILPVEELFNQYADRAGYHDICLLLYQVADHRNPADINTSWKQLINQTAADAPAIHGRQRRPWEAVGETVRNLGRRLHTSSSTFPIPELLTYLEQYAQAPRDEGESPPTTWAIDLFLDLEIPHETIMPALEQLYYSNEHPFTGPKRKIIAGKMIYLLLRWFDSSERSGERVLFGSEENSSLVQDCLASLMRSDLDAGSRQLAEGLVARIQQALR